MIVQVKRGTTAEAAAWVGLEGTFFVDLTAKLVYVHDGATAGGTLVGGLNTAAVQALIDASLEDLEVEITKVTGLTEALADLVKSDAVGVTVASLVDGKVPAGQLPDPVVVPVKATGAELIEGTDDAKFVTAASLLALLTDMGFSKDVNGDWKLDAGAVEA
ncbi:virion structural protein [Pseudomonas phage Psa21]|uniref:Virion structural protein n=1 Tax=Pseudomonas phage Psa21 TaxID=2530023 RepID=A0A481W4M0_9CAUD|nr:virion structural protein [Pseudomonas phage Psa21]QBJ02726.1 virion structural protein [Pseudomonas phage Psa21]